VQNALDAKKPFFDVFLEQAANVQTPLLLIGDLNTGRNDIDLQAGATKFSCADQFVELTSGAVMIDLWRQSNGNDAREWTWPADDPYTHPTQDRSRQRLSGLGRAGANIN